LSEHKNNGVAGCNSRIICRKSLPPWPLSTTSFFTPCGAMLLATSPSTSACVLGFMFTQYATSSWPVFTPNGMAGSTSTRAPASHARRADSFATASDSNTSVAYGKCRLCASVAPHGSTATS